MAKHQTNTEILKVVLLCLIWYIVSSTNNVVGKLLLMRFPYPMTLTMVQLVSITVYSGPVFRFLKIRPCVDFDDKFFFKYIIPLSIGKFLASVSGHISIWKVPISYAHTIKASMPLFIVVLGRIFFKEKYTLKVYLSLLPIVLGIMIATVTELSFDVIGLIFALISTLIFATQNLFSKQVLHDTGVHHLRLLQILGKYAALMMFPFWCYFDIRSISNDASNLFQIDNFMLLCIDGVLSWLQNIIAFSVLSLVTTLTYAVANASKRISVVTISILMMKNPVTVTNVFGMSLAIFGVLAYNKAKYDANMAKKNLELPLTIEDHVSLKEVPSWPYYLESLDEPSIDKSKRFPWSWFSDKHNYQLLKV